MNCFDQPFHLTPNADINGTHKIGEIHIRFLDLVTMFGMPEESDGYKVSGEWRFTSDSGKVFTIYDWKRTHLYDSSLPSVEEFREYPEAQQFSVGGHEMAGIGDFVRWVTNKAHSLTAFQRRVAYLEYFEGMTTSDAQGVAEVEIREFAEKYPTLVTASLGIVTTHARTEPI